MRVKVIWFVFMVAMWAAFFVLVALSPATLLELWAWVGSLSWWLQVVLWIVLLPWMLALAVWQTGWPDWLRWVIIIAATVFWTALSWPRRKRR